LFVSILQDYEEGIDEQFAVRQVEVTSSHHKPRALRVCEECLKPIFTLLCLTPDHHLKSVLKVSRRDMSQVLAQIMESTM
jgi:hypothetical protein